MNVQEIKDFILMIRIELVNHVQILVKIVQISINALLVTKILGWKETLATQNVLMENIKIMIHGLVIYVIQIVKLVLTRKQLIV